MKTKQNQSKPKRMLSHLQAHCRAVIHGKRAIFWQGYIAIFKGGIKGFLSWEAEILSWRVDSFLFSKVKLIVYEPLYSLWLD